MKKLSWVVLLWVLSSASAESQSLLDRINAQLAHTPHPESVSDFSAIPHLSPMNQDTTLICWSFATSSFLESEMERLNFEPVRLSVTYPVYCVFLEKAKRFVQTRGNSRFSPGDLFTGVLEMFRQYGAIPAEAYGKKLDNRLTLNQNPLYRELDQLMKSVKAKEQWNEQEVLSQARQILDKHLGAPPKEFQFKGATYTPQSFLEKVVRLPWNEYVLVTSFQYAPFGGFAELKVPDNWSHYKNYFNVPLDVFYQSIIDAVTNGYSVAFDADISEPSYELTKDVAMIPDFDIASQSIDQEAREFRFNNGSTTDDHLMQVVSFKRFGGEDWFLVKDSWRTAFEGKNNGYFFFHGSYIKLKALAFLVHRDAVPAVKKMLSTRE